MKTFHKICLIAVLILAGIPLFAQDFRGYMNSNYAGVTGIDLQPASVADSRYKVDILLTGLHFEFSNNYIGLRRSALKTTDALSDNDFTGKYLVLRSGTRPKSIYFNTQLLLPSFMVSFKNRSAMAFTWKVRAMFNLDGIGHDLATLAFNELKYEPLWNKQISNKSFSIQNMIWAEYGATYGMVLRDKGKHFIKAGGRLKLLQGIQAAYLFVDNLKYMFPHEDTLSIFSTTASYGHSENFTLDGGSLDYFFGAKPSFGLDIGIVYEYRPNHKELKIRTDKEKYKFKAGLSLLDLGRIKFRKGVNSRDFNADITNWYINSMTFESVNNFDDTLINNFISVPDENFFKMNLPTAISIQLDYNLGKDFYLNLTTFRAFQRIKDLNKVHYVSAISLSPRWDHKWFGVYMPFSINRMGIRSFGMSLRLGPWTIGTNNLAPILWQKTLFGADFYTILKVPIPHGKPPDKDGDGIFDLEDDCPEVAGLKFFIGCPDSDRDSIIDKFDDCPEQPGLAMFKGCPDRDGDMIIDKEDKCPDVPGPKNNNGCPVKLYMLSHENDTLETSVMSEDGFFVFTKLPQTGSMRFLIEAENPEMIDEVQILIRDEKGKEQLLTAVKDGLRYFLYESLPMEETKLFAINETGDTIMIAIENEQGFFIFENLPANYQYVFVLEDKDAEMLDDILILLIDEQGKEHIVKATRQEGNIFKYEPLKQREARLYLVDEEGDTLMMAYRDEKGVFVFEKLPASGNYLFLLDAEDTEMLKDIKVALVDEMGQKRIVPVGISDGGLFKYSRLPQSELDKLELMEEDVVVMLKEEEKKIVNTAFENLEFNTGSDIITFGSYTSLTQLSSLIVAKPEWKVKLSGFTDDVGSESFNLMLSKKRAEAVKKALVNRGVDHQRITVKYFGEARPVDDNKTEEGRQKNRRVEMLIIQE